MGPSYRNRDRSGRRDRTGYVDHDVFEGLPVRRWRREMVAVAPPPAPDNNNSQNDVWAVELPNGMPNDSHMLPDHSLQLLRAARSGKIYKRPAPVDDEEPDPEMIGEKSEKKEDESRDRGFSARAWKQLPRTVEGPEVEYLAKRRKGVVTLTKKNQSLANIPTLTKTTVKRLDAAGNEYVQDVVVPHGQEVEGEIISQTIIPDPNAAVPVEEFAVQPTSHKKKSSHKKKAKGPGRGRKKKQAGPTSVPEGLQIKEATAVITENGKEPIDLEGVKKEFEPDVLQANEDTEMHHGSIAATDEDGDDNEENEEDEGSQELTSPSKPPRRTSSPGSVPLLQDEPKLESATTATFEDDPLPVSIPHSEGDGKSGSPLKNVAFTTSGAVSPPKAPKDETLTAPFSDVALVQPEATHTIEAAVLDEVMQQQAIETAPTSLPPPPPEPTNIEVTAALEERQAEEEEEDMLVDMVMDESNAASNDEPSELTPHIDSATDMAPIALDLDTTSDVAKESPQPMETIEPQEAIEEVQKPLPEDDDFPDLLGDLEKSLAVPAKSPEPEKAALVTVEEAVPEEIRAEPTAAEPQSSETAVGEAEKKSPAPEENRADEE